jgi:uncharacterized protein YacL
LQKQLLNDGGAMVKYDSKVIQEHADKLYAQTRSVVASQFFIGLFMGLLAALIISNHLTHEFNSIIVSIGVLIGGVMGYGSGHNKAFELRLQAQMALCQAQIEENTKPKK